MRGKNHDNYRSGILKHCWKECELVQPFRKTVVERCLSRALRVPILGTGNANICIPKHLYKDVHRNTVLITSSWKRSMCIPGVYWYIHTLENYMPARAKHWRWSEAPQPIRPQLSEFSSLTPDRLTEEAFEMPPVQSTCGEQQREK